MKILTILLVLRKNSNQNEGYMDTILLVTLLASEINQCLDVIKKKKKGIQETQYHNIIDE